MTNYINVIETYKFDRKGEREGERAKNRILGNITHLFFKVENIQIKSISGIDGLT